MARKGLHERSNGDAQTEARNRGLKKDEAELRDPDKRTPQRAAAQKSPEAERPTTPPEDAESDVAHLENPPQSEGPRERSNNGV